MGCSQEVSFELKYVPDSIEVICNKWDTPVYIKSYHKYFGAFNETTPVYKFDDQENILYLHNPYHELVGFDIKKKEKVYSCDIDTTILPHEQKFDIQLVNSKVLFSSNRRLWILNKKLEIESSLLDTIIKKYSNYKFEDYDYYLNSEGLFVKLKFNEVNDMDSTGFVRFEYIFK